MENLRVGMLGVPTALPVGSVFMVLSPNLRGDRGIFKCSLPRGGDCKTVAMCVYCFRRKRLNSKYNGLEFMI